MKMFGNEVGIPYLCGVYLLKYISGPVWWLAGT